MYRTKYTLIDSAIHISNNYRLLYCTLFRTNTTVLKSRHKPMYVRMYETSFKKNSDDELDRIQLTDRHNFSLESQKCIKQARERYVRT